MLVLVATICALLSTAALAVPAEALFCARLVRALLVPALFVPTACIDGAPHRMRMATPMSVLVAAMRTLLSATALT